MHERDRRRIFAGEAGTLLMTLAQKHRILFEVEARQTDPESSERERAWLIPDLLETRGNAHDKWANAVPAEVQTYGRFLAEGVFLRFMGEYRHCIDSIKTEAFRDEVIFTDSSSGTRALVRPDYESEHHAIHIWADPDDKTGKSKAWCRTIKSWLTGTVELGELAEDKLEIIKPTRAATRGPKRNLKSLRRKVEGWVERQVAQFDICPADLFMRLKYRIPKASLNKIINRSEILQTHRKARDEKKKTQGGRGNTLDPRILDQLKRPANDQTDPVIVNDMAETVAKLTREALLLELSDYAKGTAERGELQKMMARRTDDELRAWLVDQRLSSQD